MRKLLLTDRSYSDSRMLITCWSWYLHLTYLYFQYPTFSVHWPLGAIFNLCLLPSQTFTQSGDHILQFVCLNLYNNHLLDIWTIFWKHHVMDTCRWAQWFVSGSFSYSVLWVPFRKGYLKNRRCWSYRYDFLKMWLCFVRMCNIFGIVLVLSEGFL